MHSFSSCGDDSTASPRQVRFRLHDGSPPASPPRKIPRTTPATEELALRTPLAVPKTHMLEFLPPNVCEQIAVFCSGRQLNNDVLSFAEIGPIHKAAVARCLEFKFSLPNIYSNSQMVRWTCLLRANLMELDLTSLLLPKADDVFELLSAPRLRVAALKNDPVVLQALQLSQPKTLRALRIRIRHADPDHVLFSVLANLRVVKLEITCTLRNSQCPFLDPQFFNEHGNMLAEACPQIRSLGIDCDCALGSRTSNLLTDNALMQRPLWRILPGMPKVKQVVFRNLFPNSALQRLQRMTSVRILDTTALMAARLIGRSVKEISFGEGGSIGEQNSRMLRDLFEACPQLRVFEINITPGAEVVLATAASGGKLKHLRSLRLRWIWKHYIAVSGAMKCIAKHCRRLETLRMTNGAILLGELPLVLERLGTNLRSFEMSIFHRKKSPLQILQVVLCATAKHNKMLRTYESDLSLFSESVRQGCGWNDEEKAGVIEQADKILVTLKLLHKRAPNFDTAPIANQIGDILQYI